MSSEAILNEEDGVQYSGDPGLQAERTVLAWHRTAVSLLINTLIIGRSAYLALSVELAVLTSALLLGTAGVFICTLQRRRRLLHRGIPRPVSARMMLFTAGLAVMTALSAAAGVLYHF